MDLNKIFGFWIIGLKIFIAGIITAVTFGVISQAIIFSVATASSQVAVILGAAAFILSFAVLGFVANFLYKWK